MGKDEQVIFLTALPKACGGRERCFAARAHLGDEATALRPKSLHRPVRGRGPARDGHGERRVGQAAENDREWHSNGEGLWQALVNAPLDSANELGLRRKDGITA